MKVNGVARIMMKHNIILIISALLCTFILRIQGLQFVSRGQSSPSTNIIELDDDISIISIKDSAIRFNKRSNARCNVTLPSNKDFIRGKIHAVALSQGNIIVWGVKELKVEDVSKHTYIFVIVDYKNCKIERIFTLTEETIAQTYLDAHVIAYDRTFDVFLPAQKECAPCRFDHNGNKVKMNYQLPMVPENAKYEGSKVQAFMNTEREVFGYLNSYNLKNERSVIRVLDTKFKEIKKHTYEYPIEALAVNFGARSNVGLCFKRSTQEYICKKLNSYLKSDFEIKVSVDLDYTAHLKLTLDLEGHLFITVFETRIKHKYAGKYEKVKVYYQDIFDGKSKNETYKEVNYKTSNFHGLFQGFDDFCIATTFEDITYDTIYFDLNCKPLLKTRIATNV